MAIDGNRVKLAIWDTAGQERFRTLTPSYYRGAQGVICVYDVTSRSSFEKLNHWMQEVDTYCTNDNIIKMMVANKIDMVRKSRFCSIFGLKNNFQPNRVVTREEGLKFAKRHRTLFIEASAKTKEGVQCTFEELIEKIIQTPDLWDNDRPSFRLGQPTGSSGGGGMCGC